MAKKETSIDSEEMERFSKTASQWWQPKGKFQILHEFNPVRLAFIRDRVIEYFDRDPFSALPFEGLRFLDIGCGGGLTTEPVTKMGGKVTGIDPLEENIFSARQHAQTGKLNIDYRATTLEEFSRLKESFDVILNLEVLEHVRHPELFIKRSAKMLKPEGLMFVGTLNRTPKAFLLAILMAEHVLRWLPQGTHQYNKLIKPNELQKMFKKNNLELCGQTGIAWNLFSRSWYQTQNTDINYIMVARQTKTREKKQKNPLRKTAYS